MKKTLLLVIIILVAIQFIQPSRNKSETDPKADISAVLAVPDSVRYILKNACYDCHSNNTRYPWYSYIQPVGWWLAGHIKDGKNNLNFNEFGSYSQRRQKGKLDGIVNVIRDDVMPLKSYRLIHKDARLGDGEKSLLMKWAESSTGTIPADQ
ncbi:MAG: heme-binding domain-containing protein [Bacteroidota bacterium]|nr:heme-binding domain-containing protein [Bacteroidota bacterium]